MKSKSRAKHRAVFFIDLPSLQTRLRFGHCFDQLSDHIVWLHSLGLGMEVQKYSMSQDRISKSAHVFDRNVVTPAHNRSSFAGENQKLRSPKRSSPVHPSL